MGMIARSDVELVEASLRGEHEAFGHLVARYQDVVCAVSYSSTGDQVLSEDVAQDTFIAAWRQLDRLRNSERLRPWLCGIARNLARTARKRRRREPFVDADEQIAPGASPFDVAARGDVERVVRDALARIPDAYREVLVLYYREDQSIREVAAALGLTEATVMQRLSRGRRYLADSVTELVESSLRSERRNRDLVAAVLATIAVIAIPSRVDASPPKGSTMLKLAIATSALVVAGTTAYLVHTHHTEPPTAAASPTLHYGGGHLGLAHAPSLGPTAAPRAIHSRSVAQADLSLLPADSDAVIGINFAKVRQSALWQRYVAPKLASVDGIREFEALCGFDPLGSLGSISLGLKGLVAGDDTSGVIVIHGFDKAKAMSCFDHRGVAAAEKDGAKVTIDGDVVMIADAHGREQVAFTFIDTTTALIVMGPDAATKQGVERIAAGNSGLQSSSTFADALQAINTDDSLWMMLADGSSIMKIINTTIAPFTSIRAGTAYVSLDVTDTLALDAGLRLGSPETVGKLVSTIQGQMAGHEVAQTVSRYFDQLDVLADGSDLIVSLAMSGDQIVQLLSSITTAGNVTVGM
ncbi:MAG TPA: sigma-70 family RNA polymerase sigma factor [Kofleriaceae bacterium]|nr:sigma-70 family RNA polymerase sigma factor [Kofleriaceae bacterium]